MNSKNETSLRGSCSCGRYNYVVVVPHDDMGNANVHFATDSEHRRTSASLLATYLRVPLTWYQSHTVAFFPDETHHSISRTFTPQNEPHCQRKFCGYCGTHLSYWTEEPDHERDYMHITIGSLKSRDIETLNELDLLPEDIGPSADTIEVTKKDVNSAVGPGEDSGVQRTLRQGTEGSVTWFEEMIDGSRLGRSKLTRRGIGSSADGTTTVQWEISEYTGGVDDLDEAEAEVAAGSKRKLEDMTDESKDTMMKG